MSGPPEDNRAVCIDTNIALALQNLEEEEVQNMEKKVHMIMRDDDLATMIQQQEED